MRTERCWNDTDGRKPKFLQRNLSQWHFAQHKSDIEWADNENECFRKHDFNHLVFVMRKQNVYE